MKKSGKYFFQNFGRDALALASAAQVIGDTRRPGVFQARAFILAALWAEEVSSAGDLADVSAAFAADTRTLASGTWASAATVAAVTAADLARRAGNAALAAEMDALAASVCPYP